MSKRTLSPRVYSLLQRFVHGSYEGLRSTLLRDYAPFSGTPVLELGCGTGTLSTFFGPGLYTGVDLDEARIEVARATYPDAVFFHADVRSLEPEFFGPFRFLFCHAWLHHIDDAACGEIFSAIARASVDTTRVLVVHEPVLPHPLRNPVGWALGKLDRGDFVRPAEALRALCEPFVDEMTVHSGPWQWPVPGAQVRLVFDRDRAARAGSAARVGARSAPRRDDSRV